MANSCETYVTKFEHDRDIDNLDRIVTRLENTVYNLEQRVRELEYREGENTLKQIDNINDIVDRKLRDFENNFKDDNNPKTPKWTDFIDELFGLIGGAAGAATIGSLVAGAGPLLALAALGMSGVSALINGAAAFKNANDIAEWGQKINEMDIEVKANTALIVDLIADGASLEWKYIQLNQEVDTLTTKTVQQFTETNNQVSEITGKLIAEIISTNNQVSDITGDILNKVNANTNTIDQNYQTVLDLINNISYDNSGITPNLDNIENRLTLLENGQTSLEGDIDIINSDLKLKLDIDSPIPSIKDIENRLKDVETTTTNLDQNQQDLEKDVNDLQGNLKDISPKVDLTVDQLQDYNIDNLTKDVNELQLGQTKLSDSVTLITGQLNGGTINPGVINSGTLNTGTTNTGELNIGDKKVDVNLLNPDLSGIESDITNLKIDVTTNTRDINNLEKQADMNDSQFNQLDLKLSDIALGVGGLAVTGGLVYAGVQALQNTQPNICQAHTIPPQVNSQTLATQGVIMGEVGVVGGMVNSVGNAVTAHATSWTTWLNGAWGSVFSPQWTRWYNNVQNGVDRMLKIATLVTVLHNAAMLSREIGESLTAMINTGMRVTGLGWKDQAGNLIPVENIIGGAVESWLIQLMGETAYNNALLEWKQLSAIYTAGANLFNSLRNLQYSLMEGVEMVTRYTAMIGNQLQEDGLIEDRSLPWMDETIDLRQNPAFKWLETLENIEDATSQAYMAVSTVEEIVENVQATKEASQRLQTIVSDYMTAKEEAEAAKETESDSPSIAQDDLNQYEAD